MSTSRAAYATALLVSVTSGALLASWVARFSVNIPWWDEWILAETIVLHDRGELTLGHLLSQHNESRKLVPRLIMLLNARCFGWNLRLEMGLSVLLAAGTFANLVLLLRRSALTPARQAPLVALAGLLVFSPVQGHNFLMGVQYIMFTVSFALTANLLIATSRLGAATRYAGTAGLALLATFSFANGMAVWVATFPVLVTAKGWRRLNRLDAAWLLAMAATLALYFADYERPPQHPALSEAWADPAASLWFLLLVLGSPLGQASFLSLEPASGAMGIVVVVAAGAIFAGVVRLGVRRGADALLPCLPWVALALYGFAGALSVTLGRAPLGPEAALQSRYVTVSIQAALGLAVLATQLATTSAGDTSAWRGRLVRGLAGALVAVFTLGIALGIQPGYQLMHDIHAIRQHSFDAFASGQLTRSAVATLFPEETSDYLLHRFEELREIGALAEPLRHGRPLRYEAR